MVTQITTPLPVMEIAGIYSLIDTKFGDGIDTETWATYRNGTLHAYTEVKARRTFLGQNALAALGGLKALQYELAAHTRPGREPHFTDLIVLFVAMAVVREMAPVQAAPRARPGNNEDVQVVMDDGGVVVWDMGGRQERPGMGPATHISPEGRRTTLWHGAPVQGRR